MDREHWRVFWACEHVFTANTANTCSRTRRSATLLRANTANTANTARTQREHCEHVFTRTRVREHSKLLYLCPDIASLLHAIEHALRSRFTLFLRMCVECTDFTTLRTQREHSTNTPRTQSEQVEAQAPGPVMLVSVRQLHNLKCSRDGNLSVTFVAVRQLHDLKHSRAGSSSARPGYVFCRATVTQSEAFDSWKLKRQARLHFQPCDSYTI
jgi:hypothetical protein